MQRPQGPGCSAWPIRPRLHVIAIGISQRCSGVGARSHPNIVLRDARGCEDIPATHSFQNALAVPRSTFCGSDPRTRSALHSKKEAPDSHEDVHFIPVKPGLLVPSASSEFGQQRALVRALVHDPGDASWNHCAGDDKDSGGREVQPRATPLLLRLSFVRQADRHLVASQDHAPLLKANSLANSILNRDRAKS